MDRVALLLIAAGIFSSGACGSKVETRRKIEATRGEESTGREHRTGYRELEGSPYNSSEEAGAQLVGD
jgi:hypothetical protein